MITDDFSFDKQIKGSPVTKRIFDLPYCKICKDYLFNDILDLVSDEYICKSCKIDENIDKILE